MITYETFKTNIEEIRKFDELICKVADMISEGPLNLGALLIDANINALTEAFNDESGWISYFIYDLDYGTKWTHDSIIDPNGESVPLANTMDLYLLVSGGI